MAELKPIDLASSEYKRFRDFIEAHNTIDPKLYKDYDIKHGLRNANGAGVEVGITRISQVNGYRMENDRRIPVPGELRYRGIDLEDLVKGFEREERNGYEEVAFLLLFGILPTEDDLSLFNKILDAHRILPENFKEDVILKIPSQNIMNKLQRIVLSLYSYDADPDNTDLGNVMAQSVDLIAKIPVMIAYAYQAREHYFNNKSLVLHQPLMGKGTAENILHLIRNNGIYTPLEVDILDLCLCVQADHGGGNNSAFATHVVSSSGTDTYSAIATAIGSLKGPRHGAANQRAHAMRKNIQENVKNWENDQEVRDYLLRILRKEAFDHSGLIYGMGHAVYTLSDPRAVLLTKKAAMLAEKTGYLAEFHLIERIARLTQELMREEKGADFNICANIDLYTGLIYEMMGIEPDLYTPLFAAARMSGWCAHRLEQILDPKIMRPAYLYLDSNNLTYTPLANRKKVTP